VVGAAAGAEGKDDNDGQGTQHVHGTSRSGRGIGSLATYPTSSACSSAAWSAGGWGANVPPKPLNRADEGDFLLQLSTERPVRGRASSTL
jgi:hypothetical protein